MGAGGGQRKEQGQPVEADAQEVVARQKLARRLANSYNINASFYLTGINNNEMIDSAAFGHFPFSVKSRGYSIHLCLSSYSFLRMFGF